jgi:hypothetical protein
VTVPVALKKARANAGLHARREVWRSLQTSDPKVARRAGPAVVERIKRDFDRELAALARGEKVEALRRHVPSDHEIEQCLFAIHAADLRDDQLSRYHYPRQEDKERLIAEGLAKARAAVEGIDDPRKAQLVGFMAALDEITAANQKEFRSEQRAIERQVIVDGDPRDSFGHLAEAIIEDSNWDVPPESPRFQLLCQRLQSMRLRALDTMAQRDAGRFEDSIPEPKGNVTKLPKADAAAKHGERLLELLDLYVKDEAPRLSPEEVEKKRLVIRLFAEHVGINRAVATIGRADLRDFKQALDHLPRAATTKREFRGLSFPAIIEKNTRLRRPTIGRATQNNYISTIGAYFRWLSANAYTEEVEVSPFFRVNRK